MRPSLTTLLLVTLALLPACRCNPADPVPITMRVLNGNRDPIYVDARDLGLELRREVGGQLFAFDDQACECRWCAQVCSGACTCPDAGVERILRVPAQGSVERGWDGVVRVAGSTQCTREGTCFHPENAPLDEPFSLQLCFSNQRPTGVAFDDAGVGNGPLPVISRLCVEKTFRVQDGLVEIGPERGAACETTAQCAGGEELCLDGACTTGCPANDYPELGSNWSLLVTSPGNMGFFTQSARAVGNQYAGTGTISSVSYTGTSLTVALSRPGVPGEQLTGSFTVILPPGVGAPLLVGTTVAVTVLDDGRPNPSRAVVVRDPALNTVLFAADMVQGRTLLTAADLAPFSTAIAETPIGCRQTGCGRQLFFERTVSAGAATVSVVPGRTGHLATTGGRWSVLNVSNGAWWSTACDYNEVRPWVMWRE